MNPKSPTDLRSVQPRADQDGRWLVLHKMATVALFLLPAVVISTPTNLLPFGLLLLISSVLGVDWLWRARRLARPYAGLLSLLALAVIVLGLWSVWHFDQVIKDVDNRSRFLVMPWALL